MEKLKYVRLKEHDEIIIFPYVLEHSTFKYLNPISAGFCYIDTRREIVDCLGQSFSLNLKANRVEDTKKATEQIFGIDALLKIITKLDTETNGK